MRTRGTEPGSRRAAARPLDPLPLLGRPYGEGRLTGLRRSRLGCVGDDAGRRAGHEPHARWRAARQLPRLLVARRPLHRLDGPRLGRRPRRHREVGRARRALRSARSRRPAPGRRARRPAGQRALVRDAVVGTRRLGVSLHGDGRYGDQSRALLLPAARPRTEHLPSGAPDPGPRVGRAGDLHARHESHPLHVVPQPPRWPQRLDRDRDPARPARRVRLRTDPPGLRRQLPATRPAAGDGPLRDDAPLEPRPHPVQAWTDPPAHHLRGGRLGDSRVRLGPTRPPPAVDAEQVQRRTTSRPGLHRAPDPGRDRRPAERGSQHHPGAVLAPTQIRDQAVQFLRDPQSYPFQGRGCGGDAPDSLPALDQETRIGHFED